MYKHNIRNEIEYFTINSLSFKYMQLTTVTFKRKNNCSS